MLGPVRGFMGERGVVAFRVTKRLEWQHPDIIRFLRIIGLRAAVPDVGPQVGKEGFSVLDALHGINFKIFNR